MKFIHIGTPHEHDRRFGLTVGYGYRMDQDMVDLYLVQPPDDDNIHRVVNMGSISGLALAESCSVVAVDWRARAFVIEDVRAGRRPAATALPLLFRPATDDERRRYL